MQSRDWNRRVSDTPFDYYRCAGCGLLFLDPIPADLGRYYPSDYYSAPATAAELANRAEPERYKIDLVRRFAEPGRLLEIGPSYGAFAYLAGNAGFDVSVVEMDEHCCEFLSRELAVNVIRSDKPNEAIPPRPEFDVIAMWHVLEHLAAPFDTVQAAAGALRPGGILVIACPNPLAFQARVLGARWTHIDAPRHLFLAPSQSIVTAVRACGLRPELITTTDTGGIGWNRFGWQMSLRSFGRHRYVRRALYELGRIAAVLAAPVERSGLRGSAYTLVLRKERAA